MYAAIVESMVVNEKFVKTDELMKKQIVMDICQWRKVTQLNVSVCAGFYILTVVYSRNASKWNQAK